MKMTKRLADAFNAQINAEIWSANLYWSMSIYFQHMGLTGFAHWMKEQSAEELTHAEKLIDYGTIRGGEMRIGAIADVPFSWESAEAVFENVYSHECHVSELIDNLVDIAAEEKDKATQEFLRWFVSEQVEEEDTAQGILDKFRNFGPGALYCMDQELGKR